MKARIKATDLMPGDWVLWKNKNVQIVRTCACVYSFGHRDVWLAHCNDDNVIECHDMSKISPIPLTQEILKKNDWYWGLTAEEDDFVKHARGVVNSHWIYDEGVGEISLFFPEDKYIGSLKIDDQRFNRYIEFFWNDTLYVHELQHALRLCGLDELADNFEIE